MGPGLAQSSALPNRPRGSWDARNAPWTDASGNLEDYARAVDLWNRYHDRLPDSHSSKIPNISRGVILYAQRFGRAKQLASALSFDVLESENGCDAIVDSIYKVDSLSICNSMFHDFEALLNCERGNNESFSNFELRLHASFVKLTENGSSALLSDALLSWLLIRNSKADPGQRLTISTMVAQSTVQQASNLNRKSGKDAFLQLISYETAASVVRQCDKNGQHSQLSTTQQQKVLAALLGNASPPGKPQEKG